jgi:hypothetical protein
MFPNTRETFCHYLIEFDIIGLILLTTGLALILLPFNLQWYEKYTWYRPMLISCLVTGSSTLCGFVIWEKYWTAARYFPYELLTDPSVAGACGLATVFFLTFYLCDSYFLSFLHVVNDLELTYVSFVLSIFLVGSCLSSLTIGLMVRYTGRYKPPALYIGVPLMMLGLVLMLHFRQPNTPIGYMVMVQVIVSFAGGCLQVCQQMAVMSAVPHQSIATVLAIQSMFASMGGAIGLAVSLTVWTNVFPQKLLDYMPGLSQEEHARICGTLPIEYCLNPP